MDLNFFTSYDFWKNVYTISKWIFTILSIFLFGAVIWLFKQIGSFRQKLNIKEAYEEYRKISVKKGTENNPLLKEPRDVKSELKLPEPNEKEKEAQDSETNIKQKDPLEEISYKDPYDFFLERTLRPKWKEIISKIESDSEKDWKFAIIEADALLDLLLKNKRVPGENMKEKLNSIKGQDLTNIDQLWTAHKVRNEIAHNSNFSLDKKEAVKIINFYKQTFIDLKAL